MGVIWSGKTERFNLVVGGTEGVVGEEAEVGEGVGEEGGEEGEEE